MYTERASNIKDWSEHTSQTVGSIYRWTFCLNSRHEPRELIERAINYSANQPITWTHLLSFFRNKLDLSYSVMVISIGTPLILLFDLIASVLETDRPSWSRHPIRPTFFFRSRRSRLSVCLFQMFGSLSQPDRWSSPPYLISGLSILDLEGKVSSRIYRFGIPTE